jgi:ABC-2 type transport system ATP-binding protein
LRVLVIRIEPEAVSQSDLLALMEAPSMAYFRNQQALGLPWGFGETAAILRPVPALFLQGNRDNLFNVTEAYWNWRYFRDAGGDARLLSMESGHMNPLAAQVEGTNDCGGIVGINTILAWFDHYLKGQDDPEYAAMPTICLSVAPTVGAPTSGSLGLALTDMPVGSQSGTGGVPVIRAQLEATVLASSGDPVFVPIKTIRGDGQYLAGIATIGQLTVTTGTPATHPGIAQIGIGIRRGHNLILVDDELAPFVAGSYTENLRVAEGDPILLPAVGEPLQRGDEVGLLFFEQTVQYSAMISPLGVAGLPGGLGGLVAGKALPHPITSVLDPKLSIVSNPNPYSVLARDVELPIVIPGTFPGSRLIPVVAQ